MIRNYLRQPYPIFENSWKIIILISLFIAAFMLIFTSSVYKADNVADKLRKNGIQASAIHSKKCQGARNEALGKFKSGELRVLVATDLISRGIDI